MTDPADHTLALLRELRAEITTLHREVLRLREERVEDRRLLLRFYEEQTKASVDLRSDLLLLDNRLLNVQSELLESRRRTETSEPV